jgi:hypothetical protein
MPQVGLVLLIYDLFLMKSVVTFLSRQMQYRHDLVFVLLNRAISFCARYNAHIVVRFR